MCPLLLASSHRSATELSRDGQGILGCCWYAGHRSPVSGPPGYPHRPSLADTNMSYLLHVCTYRAHPLAVPSSSGHSPPGVRASIQRSIDGRVLLPRFHIGNGGSVGSTWVSGWAKACRRTIRASWRRGPARADTHRTSAAAGQRAPVQKAAFPGQRALQIDFSPALDRISS